MYGILNKTDYNNKLQTLLNDSTNFKRIKRDPTEVLKKEVNSLIDAANSKVDDLHFKRITGHCSPGFM